MSYTGYKTLEFVNESEANEYIINNNLKVLDMTYGSFGIEVKIQSDELPLNYCEEEPERFVIFSHLGTGTKLYVYKSGLPNRYGYEQMMAKEFESEKQARKVAAIMGQSGTRRWLVEKLVSRY